MLLNSMSSSHMNDRLLNGRQTLYAKWSSRNECQSHPSMACLLWHTFSKVSECRGDVMKELGWFASRDKVQSFFGCLICFCFQEQ